MKQGSTLSYLHHDHLGSLVSATTTSGGELGWARYSPFGALRLSGGSLPTDRLFTGQTRDLGDDRRYWFKARGYDATLGQFQSPDTALPDYTKGGPKGPQALNRYAYVLNQPLRAVDPSGQAALVYPGWTGRFEAAHAGQIPTQQDQQDYLFSLGHPGTGAGGAWTQDDWVLYSMVRSLAGNSRTNAAWDRFIEAAQRAQSVGADAVGLELSGVVTDDLGLGAMTALDVLYVPSLHQVGVYASAGGGIAVGASVGIVPIVVYHVRRLSDFAGPFLIESAAAGAPVPGLGLGYTYFKSLPGTGDTYGFTLMPQVQAGISVFVGADYTRLVGDINTQTGAASIGWNLADSL